MKKIPFAVFLVSLVALLSACGDGGGGSSPAPLSSAKAITAYSLGGATGTIDETAKTISVTLPYGTNLTSLVATFTTTGVSVKVGTTDQISGTTANNFTGPVSYVITAADGSAATYTVTASVATSVISLPKTGQTVAYRSRDDGNLQKGVAWPNPRFSVGAGAEVDCVIDNLTGLMWPKATSTWTTTWQEALDHAAALTLCGYDDWRLPNVAELETLRHVEQYSNTTWLQNQGFNAYVYGGWSSTTNASSPMDAWVVITDGLVTTYSKTEYVGVVPVLPVRANGGRGAIELPKTGQATCYDAGGTVVSCAGTSQDGESQKGVAWPNPRFSVGTGAEAECVTDHLTGLMWAKAPDATTWVWSDAVDYVNALTLCGYSDWRLPNKNELSSLVNYGEANTATWLMSQGFSGVMGSEYWSSTTHPFIGVDSAWVVDLSQGGMRSDFKFQDPSGTMINHYLWPVRSAQ